MPSGMVIALGQAKMRRSLRGRLGTRHHAGLQRGGPPLRVVAVGPSHGGAQGPTRGCHPEAPFHPFVPRSVGWRPPRSPPMRA